MAMASRRSELLKELIRGDKFEACKGGSLREMSCIKCRTHSRDIATATNRK